MSALRAERERLGLTQKEIEAILWGMPHRTYQDIEAERRVPPEWVMLAILEKLSKRKFLAGQGEKTPDSKRRAKSNNKVSDASDAFAAPLGCAVRSTTYKQSSEM